MPDTATRFPIHVSSTGRYFVDAAGKPFFWLGDTCWPLFTQVTPPDAEYLIRVRGEQGFNVIQGVLAWGAPQPDLSLAGTSPGANFLGELPWNETPAKPNPKFFDYVDHLLERAAEAGIALAIVPVWGYSVQDAGLFTSATAHAYGRWIGERLSRHENLIWVNGGDREPMRHRPIWQALAGGIRAGETKRHLMTYHICGRHSSSEWFHEEPWLDFNMIQTWAQWDNVYPTVAADVTLSPPKPVVHGEGAYEEGPEYPSGPITPLIVRRQAWWACLAGGFPTYGHNDGWRLGTVWPKTAHSEGAEQVALMKRLLEAWPWWNCRPEQGFFVGGERSGPSRNAAVLALDRSWLIAYFPAPWKGEVWMDRILGDTARGAWVNPAGGETRNAGVWQTGNRVTESCFTEWTKVEIETPEEWEDAVLIVQREAGG